MGSHENAAVRGWHYASSCRCARRAPGNRSLLHAAVRGRHQETVPTGFLDLPAARRYALDPYLMFVVYQTNLLMPRLRSMSVGGRLGRSAYALLVPLFRVRFLVLGSIGYRLSAIGYRLCSSQNRSTPGSWFSKKIARCTIPGSLVIARAAR